MAFSSYMYLNSFILLYIFSFMPYHDKFDINCSWVLDLQCGGSRNFLSAFKIAVENEEEIKHKICKHI